jgi:hypothetical protein
MADFVVRGPYEIPFYVGRGGRTIRDEDVERFWEDHSKYEKRRGCYVFGIRAGRGFTPGYVGKATRGLKKEVLAPHKLSRYQQFLAEYAKATPVLFFVLAPVQKGKTNNAQISAIEKYLINLGVTANPDLLNVRGTKPPDWGIKGVIRGGKGKTATGTRDFRRMMGIK